LYYKLKGRTNKKKSNKMMLSVPHWTSKYFSSTTDPHHITGQGSSNNRLLQGGQNKSSVADLPPAYLMQIANPNIPLFGMWD